MPKVAVYNMKGEKVKERELENDIFGVDIDPELVSAAVRAQELNARQVIAHTKDRSEVRGGGRKPWRQKGTGRARHGSIRSPLWRGGGVTFGPRKERNFQVKLNKKIKRKALLMCLSDKVKNNKFIVVDDIQFTSNKTKEAISLLENVSLKKQKKNSVLVVLPSQKKELRRAFQNIPGVSLLDAKSLNVRDIIKKEAVLLSDDCVDVITQMYGKKS